MWNGRRHEPSTTRKFRSGLLLRFTLGLILFLGPACAIGQGDISPLRTLAPTAALSSPAPQAPLSAEAARLDREVVQLRERVDSFSTTVGVLVAVLAAVLVLGGLTSTASWFTFERRSTQLHGLALEGEAKAQRRESYIFDQSKRTIDLVNSTLELARDASRNAAQATEQSARNQLAELDRKAAIVVAPAYRQWRSLVRQPGKRNALRALANQLNFFEAMRLLFAQTLQPSPQSVFVRGMDDYLSENFARGTELWESVIVDPRSSDPLKILANYWLGYLADNEGDYAAADEHFGNAVEIFERTDEKSALKYELKRIRLESRFFDQSHNAPEDLVPQFEGLLGELEAEIKTRIAPEVDEFVRMRTHLLVTFGNVRFQAAKSTRDLPRRARLLEQAIDLYKLAAGDETDEAKYARFGLAESQHRLGALRGDERLLERGAKLFRERVLKDASDELSRRQERRTQIRALTAQLFCYVRVLDIEGQAAAIGSTKTQIDAQLGDLHEGLTVFSLMQFRNVSQDQFKKDLDELLTSVPPRAFVPSPGRPTPHGRRPRGHQKDRSA